MSRSTIFAVIVLVITTMGFGGCYRTQTLPSESQPPTSQTSPSAKDQVTTIAYIADFGDPGGPAQKVADLVAVWNPEWVVTGGDNNYPNGALADFDSHTTAHYLKWVNNHQFLPALGNHDWWKGYPTNPNESYTAEELPECKYFTYLSNCRYYSKRLSDNVEVFIYDSDRREPDGVGPESIQAKWLEKMLQGSTSKWQIVVFHEPPMSSCRHGGNYLVAQLPFKEWGADAVLAGHCHNYERLDWDGLLLIINGAGGGGGLYDFTDIHPKSRKRYKGHGYVAIEATHDALNFKFVSVGEAFSDSIVVQ